MNMIEKVARAIALEHLDPETRNAVDPDHYHIAAGYYDLAKAAIEAMREPTVVMKAAGQWFQFDDPHVTPPVNDCVDAGLNAARIWQEMIDAALKEAAP